MMPSLDRSVGGSTALADEVTAIIDTLPFPIQLLDHSGTRLRMNRAASDSVNNDAGLRIAIDQITTRLQDGVPSIAETVQSDRTWQVQGVRTQNADSDWRYLILAHDLTAALRTQESTDRAAHSAAMAALVAAVAHTVRNPLFMLSATLEAFDAVHGFPPGAREYLEPLRQQVDRLETIMRGLLEYGRPLQVDAAPGRLGQALSKAIEECKPLAERCGVSMVTLTATERDRLPMDSRRITQVFRSVLENAIEHSPQGSTIRIEGQTIAVQGSEWAECRILDHGPGFRPLEMARLFQPFLTRREGRAGLGLALSRRIVEEHRGQITAGNNPDGGAWVRVCLPLLEGNDG